MENTELQVLLPSGCETEKEEICDVNETTQLIQEEGQGMEDNIADDESEIIEIMESSPVSCKFVYDEFKYIAPEPVKMPEEIFVFEPPPPERAPMYIRHPDPYYPDMDFYTDEMASELDTGIFQKEYVTIQWGEDPEKKIRTKVREVCRSNDIEWYYFNVVQKEDSHLPPDMEVFCSEMIINCAQKQMENKIQYNLEENEEYLWRPYEGITQKLPVVLSFHPRSERKDRWPQYDARDDIRYALDSNFILTEPEKDVEIRLMEIEELVRYEENPEYDPNKKVKNLDQVESKVIKKPLDITVAIFRDDDTSVKLSIGEEQVPQTLCRRLLEAVEFNSLKCLDVICRHFDNVLKSLSPTHYSRLLTNATHHRRFHLNWPPEFASKDSPLHLIATRCSAVKTMEIFEKYPSVLEIFIDLRNDNSSTPLLLAIKKGNVAIAEKLLRNNIKKLDLTMNKFHESPLSLTALNGNANLMKIIISSTPGINGMLTGGRDDIVYEKGHTILYPASQSKNKEILEVLMSVENFSQLLECERSCDDWFDFVSNVCESGCEEMLIKIFAMDGDAGENEKSFHNLQDDKGVTPLMRAAAAGRTNIVETIITIKSGMDFVSRIDVSQKNVFHYAIKNAETLRYLLDLHTYG